MEFLSLPAMGIAAAATIPPLIALYFLKLKRSVKLVPSTLLWKRAVEDLHVNAPFQRLRSSLLLLLQLLILIAAALALGQPMLQQAEKSEERVILLIDQSASMAVVEADGKTRLERAKDEARKSIDNLDNNGRAMVIAFCDRATVVSPFEPDKTALKARIDSIEQTQSGTTLSEAISLAEAYAQKVTLADEEPSRGPAENATVLMFTDGRISDGRQVALREFDAGALTIHNIASRTDNVGLLSVEARRNYEQPELLQLSATVRNFGPERVSFDAVLYVDGATLDIQNIALEPGIAPAPAGDGAGSGSGGNSDAAPPGSVAICVFDQLEYGGSGVIEVALRIDDALPSDNHAWTVVPEPRVVQVLLVTPGNPAIERALTVLPVEYKIMSGAAYESAGDSELLDGDRSKFDVVIFDGHSTGRLPQGNYFFWASVPLIEGVSTGRVVEDEIIFNWDDTHPLLRYVAVEGFYRDVLQWLELKLPSDAVSIMEGETTPVLSHFTRGASQYLICAFSLIIEDEGGYQQWNTNWSTQVDFVVFMQNVLSFLSSNLATSGTKNVPPGSPVTMLIPTGTKEVKVRRPDNSTDQLPTAGAHNLHYARTRQVGVYEIEPALPGHGVFAVNLFDEVESRVSPAETLELGAQSVEAQAGTVRVDRPAWRYLVLAMLIVVALEWIVYNLRVFV